MYQMHSGGIDSGKSYFYVRLRSLHALFFICGNNCIFDPMYYAKISINQLWAKTCNDTVILPLLFYLMMFKGFVNRKNMAHLLTYLCLSRISHSE